MKSSSPAWQGTASSAASARKPLFMCPTLRDEFVVAWWAAAAKPEPRELLFRRLFLFQQLAAGLERVLELRLRNHEDVLREKLLAGIVARGGERDEIVLARKPTDLDGIGRAVERGRI